MAEQETEHGEWFEKAHDDELNALSILKHRDGTPSAACFLCQQMAEKYLKGFLVFNGESPPKVHDLRELEKHIVRFDPSIKELVQGLDLLNTFYITTSYPGDYPEFHWGDAEEALAAAQKIKQFVLDRVAAGEAAEQKT
ncbi:HEPN domain-containing protein [bacterium]|nr:HEPN domain-containing protein [bacterium]